MNDPVDSSAAVGAEVAPPASRFQWLNWSSLFLAFIQSVCGAFLALHGIRLLVGIGAVVLASATWKLAERLHVDAIRIPMMVVAFLGAVINLAALWQVRRLRHVRHRPGGSSRLRRKSVVRKRCSLHFRC